MKVFHVVNTTDGKGNGIINCVVDLAVAQKMSGLDVTVVSASSFLHPTLQDAGVSQVALPFGKSPVSLMQGIYKWTMFVRRTKPDFVHAHTMTSLLCVLLSPFKSRYPVISTVHNEFYSSSLLMSASDQSIAVSTRGKEVLERRGFDSDRTRTVLNGPIGTLRRAPIVRTARPLKRANDSLLILSVAGMYERKGIRDLLSAFQMFLSAGNAGKLELVGGGPDLKIFKKLAADLGLNQHVTFSGYQQDPSPFFEKSDVFVLASRDEPAGLVLAEARAAGLAVVGTDVGGIPEMLDNGEAGVLIPARDADALAKVLMGFSVDRNALSRAQQISPIGIEKFSVEAMRTGVSSVYERAKKAPSHLVVWRLALASIRILRLKLGS